MLLTVGIELAPEYFIVCFDRPKPTFRQQMFAGYQQHRPAMAEDFVPQIVLVHEMLKELGVSVFELDGYEADDVIGTIAGKAVDLETIILTGDRDLLQLVNGRVRVLSPVVGVKNTVLYDSEKVKEKFGVTPAQFVDYKALVGDASDGYPGVSGIGPKTARGLLMKYGTFENLYKHVGELPEKVGLKLATDAEQAALAKKLAKIVTDAPVSVDFEKCRVGDWKLEDWVRLFEEQGFKSLMGRAKSFFEFSSDEKMDEKKEESAKQLGLLE
jgi:DNA polymerase-1